HYQAGALTSWEKRLRPSPDKAAKADSGYSEGTDSSGTQTTQDQQKHPNTQIRKLIGREHMMQNELSLLGSLCHPRIVRLFAHHHTDTHSYLVMEFVSGGDLFEAISEKGKFSEVEAGIMVSDVSQALSYIHCKSIVHRDLKPENLLYFLIKIERQTDGICRLKLGDFGLAMVVTEPVFTICGTPTYVAPEILLETGYGVLVDIWALGVLLYILLCGFPPFRSRERDQEELFQLIKQAHLHFLSPYWDPISEEGVLTDEKHRALQAEEQSERLPKPAADTLPDNKLISTEGVPIYNAELCIDGQPKMEADRRQTIKTPPPAKIQQKNSSHLQLNPCKNDSDKGIQVYINQNTIDTRQFHPSSFSCDKPTTTAPTQTVKPDQN
uniref:Protein kinase domain-containing protein n=1 Tax=Periophthalmus magnuspinnatus TaxID=409849 RepID=A0A3B3ZMM3_9GOBI